MLKSQNKVALTRQVGSLMNILKISPAVNAGAQEGFKKV